MLLVNTNQAESKRRSTQLKLENYDSDKVQGVCLARYDQEFGQLVDKPISLLELGVHKGGSLLLWRDYFPAGNIVGIDLYPPERFTPTERIRIFQGDQTDREFLSRVANECAPQGFDIIIDDASHLAEPTKVSFWHLFDNHLKPGGIYAIEDWGTGYFEDWPDGKSIVNDRPAYGHRDFKWWGKKNAKKRPFENHGYGMVGLVKQLVDEQGAAAATRGSRTGKPKRGSKFDHMFITSRIAFIHKIRSGL